ncbi:radical SAM protein [bacterium]|nr:radical SAM protein [bacterium]
MNRFLKSIQRRFWRGYTRGAARLHELTYLFWETTTACNLSCRHCGTSCAPTSALPDELTTAEVKAAFDTIIADFDPKRITVAVTGGEPLLRPDVFEVAAHFASHGMRWGMVTNGLLMTDKAIDLAHKAGMGSVAVSLDGLQAHHEFLRGKGTFEKTADAVRRLKQSGHFEIVEVISCPTNQMIDDLDAVYEYMLTLDLDQWRLLPLAPIGRCREHPELLLSPANWVKLLDFLRAKRRAKDAPLTVTLDEEGFLGEPYEREVREIPYFCFAGIHAASILADGSVSACPSVCRSFVQGSIRERRFSEIWESEFKVFRDRRWMKQGECANCPEFADCLGNSMHLWQDMHSGPELCHLKLIRAGLAEKEHGRS